LIDPGRTSLNLSTRVVAQLGSTSPCNTFPLTCQSLKKIIFFNIIQIDVFLNSYDFFLQSLSEKLTNDSALRVSSGGSD